MGIEQLYDSLSDTKRELFISDLKLMLRTQICIKKSALSSNASYMATKWEFSIVYQTSQFLNNIDRVKEAVDEEIEDYYELIGVRKMAMNKKISKIIDLSGRLRFQKRWAQTPRIPETSVLGTYAHRCYFGLFLLAFHQSV